MYNASLQSGLGRKDKPQKKKVVMAEFSDVRYDARVIKEAKALSNHGYSVSLHMFNESLTKDRYIHKENVDYFEYAFPNRSSDSSTLGVLKKYMGAMLIVFRINLWILCHKADVYHAHNLYFLLSSMLASKIYGGKLVYDAHEIHSGHYSNNSLNGRMRNKINKIYEKLILPHCEAFIQASQERSAFLAKKYNIEKPFVINNYVPLHKVIDSNQKLRTELNLKKADRLIMFYSGGVYLGGGRRLDKVLEALQYVDIYFVIVGFMNDTIRSQLTELVESYSIESKVFILPPCPHEDLFKYASSADFGVIPLSGDAVNTKLSALNKVSEYLMAGLPILCSNYENLTKTVYDNPIGVVGETFDVNSALSIADSIKKMCNENIYEYKKNALNLAREFYNWEREEKKLIGIYQMIF
jgi:glycosyltransferase involved in cell wall biosynthesis